MLSALSAAVRSLRTRPERQRNHDADRTSRTVPGCPAAAAWHDNPRRRAHLKIVQPREPKIRCVWESTKPGMTTRRARRSPEQFARWRVFRPRPRTGDDDAARVHQNSAVGDHARSRMACRAALREDRESQKLACVAMRIGCVISCLAPAPPPRAWERADRPAPQTRWPAHSPRPRDAAHRARSHVSTRSIERSRIRSSATVTWPACIESRCHAAAVVHRDQPRRRPCSTEHSGSPVGHASVVGMARSRDTAKPPSHSRDDRSDHDRAFSRPSHHAVHLDAEARALAVAQPADARRKPWNCTRSRASRIHLASASFSGTGGTPFVGGGNVGRLADNATQRNGPFPGQTAPDVFGMSRESKRVADAAVRAIRRMLCRSRTPPRRCVSVRASRARAPRSSPSPDPHSL